MSPRASDSVGINQDRGRLPDDEVGEADARGFYNRHPLDLWVRDRVGDAAR